MATYDKFAVKIGHEPLFHKSKLINVTTGNAADTYRLIRVPKLHFVKGIWLWKHTALTSGTTATLSIGFQGNGESADVDYFMDTTSADAENAGTEMGIEALHSGKYFNAANGIITLTTGGTPTAGAVVVFADIVRVS